MSHTELEKFTNNQTKNIINLYLISLFLNTSSAFSHNNSSKNVIFSNIDRDDIYFYLFTQEKQHHTDSLKALSFRISYKAIHLWPGMSLL